MARYLATVLAVLLMVPGALGAALHLCDKSGQVAVGACCCQQEQERKSPCESTIKRDHTGCCSTTIDRSDQPAVVVEPEVRQLGAPVLAVLAASAVDRPRSWVRGKHPYAAPPPPRALGPPLYIRNCSYLL